MSSASEEASWPERAGRLKRLCVPAEARARAGVKCIEGGVHDRIVHVSGIGFLLAALSVLVVAPLVHGRAVRLTTRRLEATIPLSMAEVHADKDLLRAEFAMSTRRLETNVYLLRLRARTSLRRSAERATRSTGSRSSSVRCAINCTATEKEYAVKATAVQEAARALTDKELELAKLMGELDERSTLAEAQKIEIIALKT